MDEEKSVRVLKAVSAFIKTIPSVEGPVENWIKGASERVDLLVELSLGGETIPRSEIEGMYEGLCLIAEYIRRFLGEKSAHRAEINRLINLTQSHWKL